MRLLHLLLLLGAAGLLTPACADDPSSDTAGTAAAGGDGTAAPETTSAEAPAPLTIDELLSTTDPLVIAHAGGDQAHPHSTPYAYAESVREGSDVLELDVQLTADGVLVVQHDETVERTTGATGVVAEMTLDQLQALDSAHWFAPGCWPCPDLEESAYVFRGVRTGEVDPPPGYEPADFAVPTFRQIATRFPAVPLDVEIKGTGPAGAATARALAQELRELDRLDSTVVASFDATTLATFRSEAPEVATSPAVSELLAWLLAGTPLSSADRILQVPPAYEGVAILDAELVRRAHEEGLAVWVWMDDPANQDSDAFYRSMLQLEVDGIVAGRPAVAVAASSS